MILMGFLALLYFMSACQIVYAKLCVNMQGSEDKLGYCCLQIEQCPGWSMLEAWHRREEELLHELGVPAAIQMSLANMSTEKCYR